MDTQGRAVIEGLQEQSHTKFGNLSLELQAFDDAQYRAEIAALGDENMTDVLDELTRDCPRSSTSHP